MLTLYGEKKKERHSSQGFDHFLEHGQRSQSLPVLKALNLNDMSTWVVIFLIYLCTFLQKTKLLCLLYIERAFLRAFHAPHINTLDNRRAKLGGYAAGIVSNPRGSIAPAEKPLGWTMRYNSSHHIWGSGASPWTG